MANEQKLDTTYKVETPEGIHLVFRPASPIIRSLALICDIIMQAIILIIAGLISIPFITYSNNYYVIGFFVILTFIVYWWYFVLLEVLNNGQSMGKKWFRLKVIHDDGTPITWSSSLIRNLLRTIDMLPSLLYGIGLITGLTTEGFKRLGDIAAGTLVVYLDPITKRTHTQSAKTETPSSLKFSDEEQKTIINFAERRNTFSSDRRLELAGILSEVLDLNKNDAEQKIYQIAQHITGADTAKTNPNSESTTS